MPRLINPRLLFAQIGLLSLLLLPAAGCAQSWEIRLARADSLWKAGQRAAAIDTAQNVVLFVKATLGDTQYATAKATYKLGYYQLEKGKFQQAIPTLRTSQLIFQKLGLQRDSTYLNILLNLGTATSVSADYPAAESFLTEARELAKEMYGVASSEYTYTVFTYGNNFFRQLQYKKAQALYQEILPTEERFHRAGKGEYANLLNSLGLTCMNLDDYEKAELYLKECLAIWTKDSQPNYTKLATARSNLGVLSLYQGAFSTAIDYLKESVRLYQKVEGVNSPWLIPVYTNMGQVYHRTEKHDLADSLYAAAEELTKQTFSKKHPLYAILLNNRGFTAEAQKSYDKAINLYRQAYAIYSEAQQTGTTGAAEMMSNMARTYRLQRAFGKADSLYQTLLPIMEQQLGRSGIRYAGMLHDYAQLLSLTKRLDSAVVMATLSQEGLRRNLLRGLLSQTYRQQETAIGRWTPFISTAFDLAWESPNRPDVAKLAYGGSLLLRNLLLTQHIGLFTSASKAGVTTQFDTLRQVNSAITAQYTLPVSQRKQLDSLEKRAELLEKELAMKSRPFRQAQQELQVRWQDVGNALRPSEAVVEFISFPYNNGYRNTDSVRYMAIVLRHGDKAPTLVRLLADEAPLRRLLRPSRLLAGQLLLRGSQTTKLVTDQLAQGRALYQLIWKPLESLLRDVETIYLTPAGLLHRVSFGALPSGKANRQTYLATRYQFHVVLSSREVVNSRPVPSTSRPNMLLFGGIHYDSLASPTEGWIFLPGTKQEVEAIRQAAGATAMVVEGHAATEERVKAMSGRSPDVIHLATHGFAIAAETASSADSSLGGQWLRRINNPMYRTGLVMADANAAWLGKPRSISREDGILTAAELANLNLTGTELVVLSGCETGLGDIRGSEGVFGLQRAIKMAGAKNLLMSLWPVPDGPTSQFMVAFYRNWKQPKATLHAAFAQTQKQFRKLYPPAVWAAFVLVE